MRYSNELVALLLSQENDAQSVASHLHVLCVSSTDQIEGACMSHCRHNHPYPENCAECRDEAARWSAQADERKRIMDLINHRLTESHSRDVRMALLRLRDDLK